jgi:glycosyltransferase involved in cell wall biosynthesis
MEKRFPVSAVILTYNEELNLPACLQSVAGWAAEIFVVDSGSTDRTREVAESFGAAVCTHPFETHAHQWNWALHNLPIANSWVLALDADQQVTPDLAREIQNLDESSLREVHGIFLKRRQVFRNKWIRHGGYYPKYLLKMFRRESVETDPVDLVDHHFYVNGPVLQLQHDLIEANKNEDDISFWIEKHNRYARLMAAEHVQRGADSARAIRPNWFGNPDERTLYLKTIWARMPLYLRPFLYFGYRYFVQLGFLDGKEGAIFHFLHAFWFRLLVDINVDQLRRGGARA